MMARALNDFQRAVEAYEKGALEAAEAFCQMALKGQGDLFDALHLMGVIKSRRGDPANALVYFEKARALRPKNADLLNNRGSALAELGRFEDAVASYDEAIALRSNYADAHNNKGCVLMNMERFEEALKSYGTALVLVPENVEYTNNLGRAFMRLRRYDNALSCFDDAIELDPNYRDALINRAVTLQELKCYPEAIACFDLALAKDPDDFETAAKRASALSAGERFEEALLAYDALIEREPARFDLIFARGGVLLRLDRVEEAFQLFDEAKAKGADDFEVCIHRAMAFNYLERPEEARIEAERAVALRPQSADAHSLHGTTLISLERFPEAIEAFRRALDRSPHFPVAEWNMGYIALLCGDYELGWRGYDGRRRMEGTQWTQLDGPEWCGQPLEGKRLLLYAEQGFGDIILFARYVGLMTDMGATVILGVYPPLAALLSKTNGHPEIALHGEQTPLYHYHMPLLSVPYVLKHREKDIPGTPYLYADETRIATWAQRIPPAPFCVGIAWQGNNSGRAVPLRAFAPLAAIPGVRLISLQKGFGLEQIQSLPPGMKVETLGPDFDAGPDAFLDTAAVMMNLDLIISCDTSLAHLAGALACPVWILLQAVPDWRWMMQRSDSPWYPTARLFRRKRDTEWTDLLVEVAEALAQEVRALDLSDEPIRAPISIGELIDKITILEIKLEKISDVQKLADVARELSFLNGLHAAHVTRPRIVRLKAALRDINMKLWDIEDRLRACEQAQTFDSDFIALARSVYKTNDRRAALKRQINSVCGSPLTEVKSYAAY